MSVRHVLVTGGAGFIGCHLVARLLAQGHRVRVLDALVPQVHPSGPPPHFPAGAELIVGDVCDVAAVRRSLEGIDTVYHLAAEVGVGQSMYEIEKYVRGNDLGTAVLLQELLPLKDQIRNLVVASSMSIYGEGEYVDEDGHRHAPEGRTEAQLAGRQWNPLDERGRALIPVPTRETKPLKPSSIYAINKQVQEQMCLVVGRAYGIPTTALRFFNVFGPYQALTNPYTGVCAIFCGRFLAGVAPQIYEDGEQLRDFVHVGDIVTALTLCLERPNARFRAINIGSGHPLSVVQVAARVAQGLDSPLTAEVVGKYRHGDIRHCYPDISLAQEVLGYRPTQTLETGLPELLGWVRGQVVKKDLPNATKELESKGLMK